MKREFFALAVTFLLFVAFPAALFGYQAIRTNTSGARVIDLIAYAPANGGWKPDSIRVNIGERVRLRIAAPDVVHGFEIPALGITIDEILPGHTEEIEFVATRAGRFPFACTRWCSADHWRMRGVIEVIDPANPNPPRATFAPPLYQQLKIDLDAMHVAQNLPAQKPSAARGAAINLALDPRTQSPSEAFARLRANTPLTDAQLWDAIAFAWKQSAGAEQIARGQKLYARDCAACHGEQGRGDGTAGINLPGMAMMHREMNRGPADFTNAVQMFGASDAILHGKILRGGMGTGMPEWGSLYTDEEIWNMVSYIRSFAFDYR
ncbi:MAG: c-type cytochrome [Chloroflexi bacterium]|nr:c-type cytochrome [Chloroflexota bacterium]